MPWNYNREYPTKRRFAGINTDQSRRTVNKRALFLIFALLVPAAGLSAQDFKQMLRRADALVNFPDSDFSAEYTIVRDVPGEGRSTTVCAIFRRDADKKYVIIIKQPEINRGQGYLKLEDTVWFYDPESRKFNSTSSRERFQNSVARNSDFTRSTLAEDYDVVAGEKTKLGIYDCWLLSLRANNTEVTYPLMKLWISDDGLVRKMENYSLSGQLMRTIAVPSYQKLEGRYVANKILIIDDLSGRKLNGTIVHEKVQISVAKASLKRLPDSVFSKTFLESMSE